LTQAIYIPQAKPAKLEFEEMQHHLASYTSSTLKKTILQVHTEISQAADTLTKAVRHQRSPYSSTSEKGNCIIKIFLKKELL